MGRGGVYFDGLDPNLFPVLSECFRKAIRRVVVLGPHSVCGGCVVACCVVVQKQFSFVAPLFCSILLFCVALFSDIGAAGNALARLGVLSQGF